MTLSLTSVVSFHNLDFSSYHNYKISIINEKNKWYNIYFVEFVIHSNYIQYLYKYIVFIVLMIIICERSKSLS